MSDWQPIETAPRSDGQILTFRKYDGLEDSYPLVIGTHGPWFRCSFWSENFNSWVGWPRDVQPTHWMPLPEPPQT